MRASILFSILVPILVPISGFAPSTSFAAAREVAAQADASKQMSLGEARDRIDHLLAFPDRPTINDILQVFGGRVEGNPFLFEYFRRSAIDTVEAARFRSMFSGFARERREIIRATRKVLPAQIAALEKAFPNARFAPLGRDAAPYGDALDAFYVSIGQTDRLARINASGRTIRNASFDDRLKLLKSAGFDLNKGVNQRPFILMDRTTYADRGFNSQIGLLMTAAYRSFKAINKGKLTRTLNVVGLRSKGLELGDSSNDFEKFFRRQSRSVNGLSLFDSAFFRLPKNILDVSTAGPFIDHGLWHLGYSSASLQPNGKFEGAPLAPSDEPTRLAALAEMYAVFQEVSKPSFLKEVRSRAIAFGYKFPFRAKDADIPTVRIDVKSTYQNFKKMLPKLINGMPAPQDLQDYQWPPVPREALRNVASLRSLLKSLRDFAVSLPDANEVPAVAIEAIAIARETNKLSDPETRQLLEDVLPWLDINDKAAIQQLKSVIKSHRMLISHFSVIVRESHNKSVSNEAAETLKVVNEKIFAPMKCDLTLSSKVPKGWFK